jgi:hypothetical protein
MSKRLYNEMREAEGGDAQTSTPTLQTWHTESLWQSERIDKLMPALLAFHQEEISIRKDRTVPVGGGKMRSYTTLDEIIRAVKPALVKHGLIIHQHLAGAEVVTMIHHVSGQFIASKVAFTPMQGNNINSLQAAGGGLTYLKRYSLSALLCINADEDDDAASAGVHTISVLVPRPPLPDDKLPEMIKWLNNGGTLAQVEAKYRISPKQYEQLNNA